MADAWYADGLKFECTQCGDCCTGAPGFVWVNDSEIAALAQQLGLPIAEFVKKYVRQVGEKQSLVEFDNGDCVFFDSELRNCKVYEARPLQCRTWPFWDSNLRSATAWKRTCSVCPGSGQGQLYTLGQIEERRRTVRV